MMQNKYIFGITGGSGTGKSTVSEFFRSFGCDVIDCDLVARDVTACGTECLAELEAEFGSGIIDRDGTLLRKKLGEIVFSDSVKLERLNEITHKHITAEIFRRIENSDREFVGIDGAVIFESGITKSCDCVIGVLADRETRICRIMARDGLTRESAEKRISSQKSDDFYIEKCSKVLYNNGNRDELKEKVREVVSALVNGKNEKNIKKAD